MSHETRQCKFHSRYSKAERQKHWDTCAKYLRRYPTLDAARKAAANDGITFDTSVWITAMSKLLGSAPRPSVDEGGGTTNEP